MKLSKHISENGKIVVNLSGELDAYGARAVRGTFESLAEMEESRNVSINMNGVDFIDSSGIGEIIFLYKGLKGVNRNLELIGVRGKVWEVLELLKIHQAIPVSMFGGD